jgi:hypothetical protein
MTSIISYPGDTTMDMNRIIAVTAKAAIDGGGVLEAWGTEVLRAVAAHQPVPAPAPKDPDVTGARQQQLVEVEGLDERDGMKVADIAAAMGGHDVSNTLLILRALEQKGIVELVPGKTPQHWRLTRPYAKGRRVWDREELILALDAYAVNGTSIQDKVEQLKIELDRWAVYHRVPGRTHGSIAYKLGNFTWIATDGKHGLRNHGAPDKEIYDRFAGRSEELAAAAAEIRRQNGGL